jgi:hypothetical protein
VSNTRDALMLDQYEYHPVLIVGEMMRGLPKHHLLPPESIPVGKAFTDQTTFTLWKKKLGKESVIIPIRTHNHSKQTRIRGELYFLPTSFIYRLDKYHHNHVFFKRKRVKVNVPHSIRIKRPDASGTTVTVMSEGHNFEVSAWMYIGVDEHWDKHLDAGFIYSLTDHFFPRDGTKPYFCATVDDFTTDRREQDIAATRIVDSNGEKACSVPSVPVK